MKNRNKSSITLPPEELKMVNELMKKIGAKSKIEVIRKCLRFFIKKIDRKNLKLAYHKASYAVREEKEF